MYLIANPRFKIALHHAPKTLILKGVENVIKKGFNILSHQKKIKGFE